MIIRNGNLILEDRIAYGVDVKISDGVIVDIGVSLADDGESIDCTGKYVSAGFIDIHTHGGYGSDFMDASDEAFDNVLRFHLDNGTTTVIPTSVTAPVPLIVSFMDKAREYMAKAAPYAHVRGVHLEGPFLSVKNKGAQKEEYLLDPMKDDYSFILEYKDIVKTVTISPELDRDGSMTEALTKEGIMVAGGHDDGIYPEFVPSIEKGLRHLTHMFCAMSDVRFKDGRRNVGLREYGLIDEGLTAEIIADNRHIPPELARLIFKCKGRGMCVVSDSLRCAGMPNDGRLYRLGSGDDETAQLFKVSDGVAVLSDGTRYAGSITPVHKMVKNLMAAGIDAVDAFAAATSVPAGIIGATDIGKLEVGCKADLLVLDDKFDIEKIYINSRWYR